MLLCVHIPPILWQRLAPWLYSISIVLLATVLLIGHIGKGAQTMASNWHLTLPTR